MADLTIGGMTHGTAEKAALVEVQSSGGNSRYLTVAEVKQAIVSSATSTSTLTVNVDSTDHAELTALAGALSIASPTGTPVDGQKLVFRFKDNGTARALSWNAIFRAVGITLPTTTVISKTVYVGCIYNSADTKWDAVATGQEA